MSLASRSTTIDVRDIARPERHTTLLAAFRALGLDEGLDLVNDHDPRPLYHQLQAVAPGGFSWVYAQNGPDVWRVSIKKTAPAHGSSGCCGGCGGAS